MKSDSAAHVVPLVRARPRVTSSDAASTRGAESAPRREARRREPVRRRRSLTRPVAHGRRPLIESCVVILSAVVALHLGSRWSRCGPFGIWKAVRHARVERQLRRARGAVRASPTEKCSASVRCSTSCSTGSPRTAQRCARSPPRSSPRAIASASALARELHDSVAQHLAAVLLQLSAAERDSSDPSRRRAACARRATPRSTRCKKLAPLSHALHPGVLDDLGLEAALRKLARDSSKGTGWTST